MNRLIQGLERVERWVLIVLFSTMLIMLTIQIILRYFFNTPLVWSEEFSRYIYVWLVFLGMGYCVTQDKHVAVTLAVDRMPPAVQKILKVAGNLLVIAAMLYLLPHSFRYALSQHKLLSGCMEMPMSFLFLVMPVCCLLTSIHMALSTACMLRGTNRDVPGEEVLS